MISASTIAWALTTTGRITGIDFTQYARCGWAQDLSLPVADRAMLHADNAYHLPDVPDHIAPAEDQHPIRHRLSRLWRPAGHGRDRTGAWTTSRTRLDRDPLDVRRANYYADRCRGRQPRNAEPRLSGHQPTAPRAAQRPRPVIRPAQDVQTTPYHMPVEDFILHALTDD